MAAPAVRLIGDAFLARGLIDADQLAMALEEQQGSGLPLGEILVAHGWVTRLELAGVLTEHWQQPGSHAVETPPGAGAFDLESWLREAQAQRHGQAVEPRVGSEPVLDPVPTPSGFVAFAPTAAGYRLVDCDGPEPQAGDHVVLPQLPGPFVVLRVCAAALPRDRRRFAFLERHTEAPGV